MSPTIRNGDLVIFSNNWGEVILRRARDHRQRIFFSAESTIYAPFHPDSNTRIYRMVVAVW